MKFNLSISQFNIFIFVTIFVFQGCSSGSSSTEDIENNEPTNSAPTVDAGTNQSVSPEDTVTLSATIVDDGSYSINWSQTSGISVQLSSTTSEIVTFTAPTEEGDLIFEISVDDGVNLPVTDTVTITVTTDVGTGTDLSVWIVNTTGERSTHILDSSTGLGVEVNVQSATIEEQNGADYIVINSYGIPKYDVTITEDILESLTSRPRAASDFLTGTPTIELGDLVKFGQDIGYSSNGNCTTDYGYGYWPPGPECPTRDDREIYLPNEPTPTEQACPSGLGKVGVMINGTSIYNWGDGQSYNNAGDWQNLAPLAEKYDVDICGGHAARDDYHHHFYSKCLADLVGDEGTGHSPLYGYAADGYPVYGPYEADGILAKSAWTTRDYSPSSDTGCSDGARSCRMVDPYDISLGTETVSSGPGFTDTVLSLSGNEFTTTNGFYYEDYYWDSSLTELGGEYLDKYNAHFDEDRGYHYHITLALDSDNKLIPAFPYIIGTRFAGELADNSVASCDDGSGGRPPPP